MRRTPAPIRAALAVIARRRSERQAAMPAGFALVYARDLRPGDRVVYHATLAPWFTVERIEQARASGYLIVFGTLANGSPFRTSRHKIDDLEVARG